MKCLYDCGLEHGFSEPCASKESPFYDPKVSQKVLDSTASAPSPKVLGLGSNTSEEPTSTSLEQEGGKALTQTQRNQRWREKNREKYNTYMRNYRSKQ